MDLGLVGFEEGAFLEAQFVGLVGADVGDGLVGDAEGIFLGNIFIEHSLLQFQPVLLLEVIVVLRPRLMQVLHLALDALLDLHLLLVQLPLQQLRAVLHQDVSVHQVEFTSMRHFNDA